MKSKNSELGLENLNGCIAYVALRSSRTGQGFVTVF